MSGIVLCEYGDCKTTSIDKSDGEMTYCNRKGKHMFFYEIELRVKWAAEIDEKKITGQIRCPSICDEEPISSMEIRVTCDAKSKEGDILKTKIKEEGVPVLRDLLVKLLDETREHFKEPLPGEKQKAEGAKAKPVLLATEEVKPDSRFKNISMKFSFDSSPELMYQCLTDDQRLSFFTQSKAVMDKAPGGKFSLFGGQITGVNRNLVENKQIEQDWRFQNWPAGHFSKVKIVLTQGKGTTEISLEQTGVPVSDFERTQSGWEQQIWSRIRAAFGYNYRKV